MKYPPPLFLNQSSYEYTPTALVSVTVMLPTLISGGFRGARSITPFLPQIYKALLALAYMNENSRFDTHDR